jgi:hypothetical protein
VEALNFDRHRRPVVTPRAIVIGVALIPLNAYWIMVAEFRWYEILTLNPLFVTPVFFLLLLAGVNALLRAVRPSWAFTVAELLVIYIMLAVSCTVATHDFGINLITMLGWGAWFATPENKWETTIFPYSPKWALVWDKDSLHGFMDGGVSMYNMRMLGPWLMPLAVWIGFMLVLFGTMMCLNVMVRKAWIEDTKLSFPVVRLPLAMVGLDTPRLYASKLLWIGAALPIISGTLNGLSQIYPALPHMQTRAHWPAFSDPPWNMLGAPYSFYPFAIGLGYFVPLDVLFSCWFFYLFVKAQIVLGYFVGLTRLPDYPYAMEQGIGAWTTYGILSLYVTRHHWKRLLHAIVNRLPTPDKDELMPYRVAFYGAIAGIVALIFFWRAIGMTALPATIAVLIYFLLALCITRVRAEAGSQHTVWDLEPMNLFPLVDTKLLGRGNIIGAGLSHWFWRLNRSHAMPTQLEGLKMWQAAGLRPRDLLLPLVTATVVSSIAGPWAILQVGYRFGAAAKCVGYARWTGGEIYGWLGSMLNTGRRFELPRWIAVFGSSGLTLALWVLQIRYTWLWLHPLGYCAGPGLIWLWCPFMIAWAVKYVIVRYGGQKVYHTLIPFFLGLALGDYVTGAVWSLVSNAMQIPGYQIFH